jgi:hypothetical protein
LFSFFFSGEVEEGEAEEVASLLSWKLSCIFLPTMKILVNTNGTVNTIIIFFVKLYTKYPTRIKNTMALKLPVIKNPNKFKSAKKKTKYKKL